MAAAAVLCGAMIGARALRRNVDQQQKAIEAQGLIATLSVADIGEVPRVIADLDGYRTWVDRLLDELARDPRSPKARQRAKLALLATDPSGRRDPRPGNDLRGQARRAGHLGRFLFTYRKALIDRLWVTALGSLKAGDRNRLMGAGACLRSSTTRGAAWPEIAASGADQARGAENVLKLRAWSHSRVVGPAASPAGRRLRSFATRFDPGPNGRLPLECFVNIRLTPQPHGSSSW